jgi:phosphoribosylaminoimidazolecarboxamide formyltransferase/IMP cyclohydrolase
METGYQRGKIQDESMHYEMRKHTGELPIIGVNTFRNPQGDAVPQKLELARSTDEEKQSQLNRLYAFHAAHAAQAHALHIPWIDVVVVNLYPFEAVTRDPSVDFSHAVENIDIGGPTMIRASAKNHAHVVVVTNPARYEAVADALGSGSVTLALRRTLALEAFQHTARYDALIAEWLAGRIDADPFPAETAIGLRLSQDLRYGENPHQRAAFYGDSAVTGRSLARIRVHQGKALSFNNLADLDAALRVAFEPEHPGCAIIKHHSLWRFQQVMSVPLCV